MACSSPAVHRAFL